MSLTLSKNMDGSIYRTEDKKTPVFMLYKTRSYLVEQYESKDKKQSFYVNSLSIVLNLMIGKPITYEWNGNVCYVTSDEADIFIRLNYGRYLNDEEFNEINNGKII